MTVEFLEGVENHIPKAPNSEDESPLFVSDNESENDEGLFDGIPLGEFLNDALIEDTTKKYFEMAEKEETVFDLLKRPELKMKLEHLREKEDIFHQLLLNDEFLGEYIKGHFSDFSFDLDSPVCLSVLAFGLLNHLKEEKVIFKDLSKPKDFKQINLIDKIMKLSSIREQRVKLISEFVTG